MQIQKRINVKLIEECGKEPYFDDKELKASPLGQFDLEFQNFLMLTLNSTYGSNFKGIYMRKYKFFAVWLCLIIVGISCLSSMSTPDNPT